MDYRERGYHARGVYHTQYTSLIATETVKQESNSKRVVRNMKKKSASTKKKSPKQGLTRAKDLTIELPRLVVNLEEWNVG